MNEHYFVTADHGHLRIYRERQDPGQREPDLDPVESMDFPAGVKNYTARESAPAGRFQSSKPAGVAPGAPNGRTGMSIDERLPMQREEERRRARDVAAEIDAFFAARPEATWDFAGAPAFYHAVLDQVSDRVRQRRRRTIAKDLVNQRTNHLRAQLNGARA